MRQRDVDRRVQALLGDCGSGVMSGGFTHFDAAGNAAMVDVSAKPVTDGRRPRAPGW